MARITPLGALVRGLVAGAAGAALQSRFFKATAKLTPPTPPEAFSPPEAQQQQEMATETVARRAYEQVAQQGPLSPEQKAKGSQLVHYAFGAGWGGLYGLSCETFPGCRTVLGASAFATTVWMVSDNVLLPAFKLAAWPNAYPAKTHLYAWVAHLAYGAGVWATYEALRPQSWSKSLALVLALRRQARIGKHLPRAARPAVRRAMVRSALAAVDAREAGTLH